MNEEKLKELARRIAWVYDHAPPNTIESDCKLIALELLERLNENNSRPRCNDYNQTR